MGDLRPVLLVTDHDDTAELYAFGLEHAGYAVERCHTPSDAVEACRSAQPLAVVVHFTPRQDPATVGFSLRALSMRTVLIGLFSIQLPLSTLKRVLETFDDVIMIPCSPDALVARLVRLQQGRRKEASA